MENQNMTPPKSAEQIAYETYSAHVTSQKAAPFEQIPQLAREAWGLAVKAVREHQEAGPAIEGAPLQPKDGTVVANPAGGVTPLADGGLENPNYGRANRR